MSNENRVAGKVALITGASRGIGAAIALKFAEHGAVVVVSDIHVDRGEAKAQEIGGSASFLHLNVCDLKSWESGVASIVQRHGGLDILVNNAGGSSPGGRIDFETVEQHRQVIDLNLTGVWTGIRTVIPAMTSRGGGSIVNISSMDGLVGVSELSTYVAAKFAVTGMTRALALELGGRGIRVNSVHPGIIATELVKNRPPEMMTRLNRAVERQPMPRMGRPEEIANAALFFASDESSFCTGSALLVDGGHIAGPHRDPLDI
jgi:3alpha(or 20beta)-hydroxysteroid dehydrogenase